MNPNTKAPEVASAFAAFLGSTEAQKKHWEMRQIIPSDKTLTNLEGMSTSPYVQAQLDTIAKTSVAQPTISAMSAWWYSRDLRQGPGEQAGQRRQREAEDR